LLGNLLEQSSHGQITFGKEPDNRDQLPEEAKQEDLENKETDDALLNDKPDVDAGERQANLIGNRMARSRQRLALNGDPGKVTQLIQKKILDDLDALIEQARKQQAQARNSDQQSKAGEKQQNQPAEANQQANQKPNQRSGNPAQDSTPNAGPAASRIASWWKTITSRFRQRQDKASETEASDYPRSRVVCSCAVVLCAGATQISRRRRRSTQPGARR
jgi:cobalamin biosynthesis Mg chelatase CobN